MNSSPDHPEANLHSKRAELSHPPPSIANLEIVEQLSTLRRFCLFECFNWGGTIETYKRNIMDPDRVRAYLQVACAGLGFDIGEIWWTTNSGKSSRYSSNSDIRETEIL
jgi:hypothetical protein